MAASGFVGVGVQGKPGPQTGSAAKRFRNNLFKTVHPIDGCAIGLAVEADAVVGFGNGVGSLLPEPENTAVVTFLHVNKASFVGRGLKLLKAVHSGFSMCLFPVDMVSIVTGSRTFCSNGNGGLRVDSSFWSGALLSWFFAQGSCLAIPHSADSVRNERRGVEILRTDCGS